METSSEDSQDEKHTLLGKLKRKFKNKNDGRKKGSFSRSGNKNAARPTRRIQLGLKVDGKHIRKESTGGGKRVAQMEKHLGKYEIIAKAKTYFFQEGNMFGPAKNYQFNLENFEERVISDTETIADMYESTGLPLLRFYLCATLKKDEHVTSISIPDDVFELEHATTSMDYKSDEGSSSDFTSPFPLDVPEFIDLGTPTVQARLDPSEAGNLSTINDIHNYEDIILESEASEESKVKVKLHRGHVLKELIGYFMENDVNRTVLEIQMIMPNGIEEPGEDTGGVLRDTLSEFWESFYRLNTTGDDVKVPCIRDTMTKNEWRACADILVIGFKMEGYFPHKLAKPFLQYTMDGDDTIMNKNHHSLIPTFLEYVPESERILLRAALENFDSIDKDDLIDILDSYQVRRNATAENLEEIMRDTAHRTLIQGPAYISRCWHRVFVDKLKPILRSNISDICDQAVPTHKRVIDSIILPDQLSEAERNTGKLLKKYIRSLSNDKLITFMRYTTGANIMLGRKITIRFVEQSEFERRPVSHTCGCVLELSPTYKDFVEFRTEFNSILEANIWVMDIV